MHFVELDRVLPDGVTTKDWICVEDIQQMYSASGKTIIIFKSHGDIEVTQTCADVAVALGLRSIEEKP